MYRPLFRSLELLQCGHVIGPVYRTDKHTFPFFFPTPVIWYSGSPMIASDCSKTFLPKTVLSAGSFLGLPLFLIKSLAEPAGGCCNILQPHLKIPRVASVLL